MGNFLLGIKSFITAIQLILTDKAVFSWFKKTSFVAFLVAISFIVLLLVAGSLGILSLGTNWGIDAGAILWVIGVLYFSGTLCLSVMSLVVGVWGNEEILVQALMKNFVINFEKTKLLSKSKEIFGALISAIIAIVSWPFLLVIPLAPIGILMMSWAFGQEANFTAFRIIKHSHIQNVTAVKGNSILYNIGLGLFPVLITLIPVIGWAMWPVLLLSAVIGQIARSNREQIQKR